MIGVGVLGGNTTQRRHRARVEEALLRYQWARRDEWIAAYLGISVRSVERWREKLGCWRTQQRGWYTTGEAARVTGLTSDEVRALARAGRIHARRVPRRPGRRYSRWLIAPESVEALVAERNAGLWRKRGTAWR